MPINKNGLKKNNQKWSRPLIILKILIKLIFLTAHFTKIYSRANYTLH